jgi:hypothetical protein
MDSDDDERQPGLINPRAHLPTQGETESLRAEVARLRELVNVASTGASEARYFELHKRHRELNVKYEAERARATKLMAQITDAEKDRLAAEAQRSRGVVLPSQRIGAQPVPLDAETAQATALEMTSAELEDLRLKFDRAQKSNAALRKTNDELKRDITRMKKVVALELGDEAEAALASIDDDGVAVSPTSAQRTQSAGTTQKPQSRAVGWKSRAEQIGLLKSKTKELTRQLTASRQRLAAAGMELDAFSPTDGDFDTVTVRTGMTGFKSNATGMTAATGVTSKRDFDEVNRERIERKELKRVSDTRDAERATETLREEATKEKGRADALQARLQNLERDNQHLRLCVSRMVEKTENDDALIAEYKDELERQRHELKEALAGARTATGAGRRQAGEGPSPRETSLMQEVARLNDVVADLRRKQATGNGLPQPLESAFTAKNIVPDDGSLLGSALALIQSQREALYSMERQLEKADRERSRASASAVDVPALLRDENIALKERVVTLTNVSEREILLYKSAADHYREAQESRPSQAPQTPIGGALAAPRGRPPSSSTSTRPNTAETVAINEGAAKEAAEVVSMRQQYAELKKAYNALAMQKAA